MKRFLMYVWLNLKTIKFKKKPIVYSDFSISDGGNGNFVYNIIDCVNATLKIGDTQENTLVKLKKIPRHLTKSQLAKHHSAESLLPSLRLTWLPSSQQTGLLTIWPTNIPAKCRLNGIRPTEQRVFCNFIDHRGHHRKGVAIYNAT